MSLESTAIHEAGHGVLCLLDEEILGAPIVIAALPEGDTDGRTMRGGGAPEDWSDPKVVRAFGRMLMAGAVAERLAGFPMGGISGDVRALTDIAVTAGRGDDFREECIAGAEYMLRSNWGAVETIAGHLRTSGELYGAAIEVARMALREKPMRTLGLDMDTIVRLAGALEAVPEIAGPLKAACALWQPRKVHAKRHAKPRVKAPAKRGWTRPTSSYLDPDPRNRPGIQTIGGRPVSRRPSNQP